MKFVDLCLILEEINNAKTPQDKLKTYQTLLKNYRNENVEDDPKTIFYPLLRLLLPQLERERGAYGLKEFGISKTIINLFCMNPKGPDANLLKNYKTSNNNKIKDFSDAAYAVLRKRGNASHHLSIHEINQHLDMIAVKNLENDPRGQEQAFDELFKITSPEEQKWIIKIILKELKIGLGQDKLLTHFHKDASKLFDTNNDLQNTCEQLYDPSIHLNEIEISMFKPFKPMLSLRCDAKQFNKSVSGERNFFIEKKFDGERFQLHMADGTFKYFSRNGFDYTSIYGENYTTGLISPFLVDAFVGVQNIILDGEMMGWNKRDKTFGSKGMNFDVKKLTTKAIHRPCFIVFDLLFLNDEVLTSKTLRERKRILSKLIKSYEGVIFVSVFEESSRKLDIINALNESMDNKEEGIIFKDPESLYVPNERSGWWKMKLEFFEGVMSDLDVIIMGGYYGNTKKINGFLVGVIDKNTQTYLSFAKIASGLNQTELDLLEDKLGPFWMKPNLSEHEKFGLKWGREIPNVWIKPENSCCLLVRGSELTKIYGTNPEYMSKYTLRFPRIQSIRLDKPIEDSLSTQELNNLTSTSLVIEKLNKRHLELSDLEMKAPAKKRKKVFCNELKPVEMQSSIFENYEFLVLTGKGAWTKELVEIAIRENGGTVVGNEGKNTLCLLAGDEHTRLKTYKGVIDIVKVDWIRDCLNQGDFEMYTPNDALYMSPNSKTFFMNKFDKFGDKYESPATVQSIKNILNNENFNKYQIYPTIIEYKEFHREINFVDDKIFRGYCAYFDKYKIINDHESKQINSNFLDELDFTNNGGKVADFVDLNTKFIITNISDEDRVNEIKYYLNNLHNKDIKIIGTIQDI